ncbi:MAG: endonuclease/exonuclease/phosphatase family protein [Bacteroidetes bacterium]|nr:endonuclease/exonuclease/phosphatase family protein [Bacteroidota bacterium]
MRIICFVIPLLLPALAVGQSVVIDGRFADWDSIAVARTDPTGDGGTSGIDFTNLQIAHDDARVYIHFDTGAEILLQENNPLRLYVDTDGLVSTGQQIHGMSAELTWSFGGREGQVRYDFNLFTVNHAAIGLVPSPTMTSSACELSIERGTRVAGQQLFSGDSIHVMLVVGESGGDRIPDLNGGTAYRLDIPGIHPPQPLSLQPPVSGAARLLTWNTLQDGLIDQSRQDAFRRILTAVHPDIMCFQECFDATAGQVLLFVRSVLDPPEGRSWRTLKLDQGNVLITHFDIEDSWLVQSGYRESASLLRSPAGKPVLLINAHFRCCEADAERQQEADGVIAFLRDAKSFDGRLTLAKGTPMMLVGDLNLVGDRRQYETLITGDIADNARYGPDIAPDWAGGEWTDFVSRHPVSPLTFTWRNPRSSYAPARLDYILYTRSTMEIVADIIVRTDDMSAVALARLGLQSDDCDVASDHFPRFVDFVWKETSPVREAALSAFGIAAVFPQPARDVLHVDVRATSRDIRLTMHDLLGREVRRVERTAGMHPSRMTLDIRGLQSGLYLLRATDGIDTVERTAVLL